MESESIQSSGNGGSEWKGKVKVASAACEWIHNVRVYVYVISDRIGSDRSDLGRLQLSHDASPGLGLRYFGRSLLVAFAFVYSAFRARKEPWNICSVRLKNPSEIESSTWAARRAKPQQTLFASWAIRICVSVSVSVAFWAVIKRIHFSADCCAFPLSDSPTLAVVYIFIGIIFGFINFAFFSSRALDSQHPAEVAAGN